MSQENEDKKLKEKSGKLSKDNTKGQRSGPWSRKEKEFIAEKCHEMSYEDIAKHLKRNPNIVKKYIQKTLGSRLTTSKTSMVRAEYDIQGSPIWKELEHQFNEEELKLFMFHWRRIIGQFKDDVFPTEEMQVVDTIKLELLMSRVLKSQRESTKSIDSLEKRKFEEEQKPVGERDLSMLDSVSRQLAFHRAALETLSDEYSELLNRKSGMLKDLRATRSERIKKIEESKQTFVGWIVELMRNPKLRTELGSRMEKMRIAVDLEKVRLMAPHKYADGMEDLPILNSESINKITEETQEEQDIQES